LIQFRIRRKVLNRENSLTLQQKEELYNNSNLSVEDFDSLERKSPAKLTIGKDDKVSPRIVKCLP
jgi:hypothetical protein